MGQWGRAYLRPRETDIGRIGTLICGENTNALARFALRGEQVHIANYPPAWPFHRSGADAHNYNLTEAIRIRSAAHAFEGKVFNMARPVRSTPMQSINSRVATPRSRNYCKRHLRRCRCSSGRMANSLLTLSSAAKAWLWPGSTRLIAPCGSETCGVATNSRLTSRLRAHKTRAP